MYFKDNSIIGSAVTTHSSCFVNNNAKVIISINAATTVVNNNDDARLSPLNTLAFIKTPELMNNVMNLF